VKVTWLEVVWYPMDKGELVVIDNQEGRVRVAEEPDNEAATFQELKTEPHSLALRVKAVRVLPEHVDAISTLNWFTVEEPDCQDPALDWVMVMEELLQLVVEEPSSTDDPVVEVLPWLVVEVDELVVAAAVELVVLALALVVEDLVVLVLALALETDDVHPVPVLVQTHSAASVQVGEPLLPQATCL
jgi:hypothetical protein